MPAAYPPDRARKRERRLSILGRVSMVPVTPPLEPILARRADALPSGDYLYEP